MASTVASAPTHTHWDVFLSFRGIDTRHSFTDHLYDALNRTGIRTFMDDPELSSGEVISHALLQAIQESKTYIVVFSKNYASSAWCLDELVAIYNCYQTMKRSVIAVFYKIDPSVVRYQTGRFKEAFEKHQIRFDMDRLDKWRSALTNVAGLSGYHVLKNMSQTDIIKKVVDRVLLEINPLTLDVAKYPVGLDSRVKAITTLLSSDKEGVIRIGIHGMGGVGKTTLAKAVYNQNYGSFHGSCFLADVREVSSRENGLVSLQQKLIDNVLKRKNDKIDNVDQGIELIRARICSKKVLIVIDDLDNSKLLEFLVGPFAMGSIIILTTRNEDLLDSIKVKARYKVNELGDAESCQLFSQHAFGDNKVPDTFKELSQEILQHAGGLPLALKVFGSNLLNQPEGEWRWFIDKLKRVSIEDIENKLMISFQALKLVDPVLQNIYLDIACFFVGHKKEEVVNIMETCYTFVNHHIDILKKRCLLTTTDEDELGMHDLLRDMGREIARNKSPDEPWKHSRLWVSKDICNVLKKHKGTAAIECIIPRDNNQDALNGVSFTTETFKRMSKLRFLYLEKVNITGSFEQTFEDLRLLCWKYCPLECLPPEFDPQKLVILELRDSKLRRMWELNMVSHSFEQLKTLNMSFSRDLTTTPDFTKLPRLVTLNLMRCESLEEVHISIGSLVWLVSLNLGGCIKLRSLPDTICNLRALEVLSISDCIRLEVLPIELGNIQSLKKLNACGKNVLNLPDSIGRLMKLVELILNGNENLETLPNTICNLRALTVLSIYGCTSLEVLPTELGNIESLTTLIAGGLCVSELPESIGRLTKLVELDLRDNMNLETLPDTICNMRSLEILDISECEKLEMLPDQLWKLTSLRELNASSVSLQTLPDIESSQIALSLQKLDLIGSFLSVMPPGICHLSNLKYLYLMGCCHLLSIPELPPNLKMIRVDRCKYLERLPNLSNLKQLEILDLTDCISLTDILGLEELTSLEKLHLTGCNSSLLAYIFTKRLFQIYSGFWQQINIYAQEFPDLISQSPGWNIQSSNLESKVSLDLRPNVSHNFLGMILCFKCHKDYDAYRFSFSVKTTSSDFVWSCTLPTHNNFGSLMVIVPRSIFPVTDGDNRIELTADEKIIFGIHLLYKPYFIMSDAYDSTTVDELKLVDPRLQDIFLDIACFFIGRKKEEVVNIMETFYTSVNHNIDILKERCLLTINDRDELEMHDLFQHMAKKIVRNNSPTDPGKHSRLWLSVDIYDVLKNHKGTEAIEGIIPHNLALEGESFTTETFKSMSKLRFLHLKKVKITGSFEQTFEDLRWLRWDCCPFRCLPYDFYPQNLVILELPHSNITTMWQLNMVSHVFKELKTLNMSYSQDLTSTPDFTKMPYLETLNLEGCESLEEVHISIGSLLRLVSLDLRSCVKLRSLPDTICNLRTLKVLTIDNCTSLEALPTKMGNIESLTKLNAYGLTVSKLPNSIRRLSKLVELNLRDNKYLKNLPHTICNLRALEVLDIIGCSSLDALPTALGNIKSLRELNAEKLTVSKLPDSIGHFSKLVKLRLSSNKDLETLPNTICNLISLEILDISGCEKLDILPDQLWKLTSLRVLNAVGATLLKMLPDIESSQIALPLQKLDISESALTSLPSGISQLLNLKNLDLSDCSHLLSIMELPPNLKLIIANGCTSMERLPNLSNLKQLEELDLAYCSSLTEILGLEELTALESLDLTGCNKTLLACILTKRFFQMYSEFGHSTHIYAPLPEFPDWISQSSLGATMSIDVPPNVSNDLLGMILCFKHLGVDKRCLAKYSVKNTTSDFIWRSSFCISYHESLIVIVPRSIFSVRDGDSRIELTRTSAEVQITMGFIYSTKLWF